VDYIERQLPHSIEAEQAVLGAVLIDTDAYPEVSEILTPDMFYRPAHSWLFEAMGRLFKQREPLDILALENELRRMGKLEEFGGLDALLMLTNAALTSLNAPTYARIVAETATRRRLLTAAGKIAKAAYSDELPLTEVVALAETEVLAAGSGATESTVKAPRRYMTDYLDSFMADVVATDAPRVVRSGLVDLDRMMGGFERGHQYIVAGSTSMGKSSFALGVALDAAHKQGKRVMIFSLEMSEEQLVNRLISMMTGISVERLRAQNRRHLTTDEQSQVMRASGELSDCSLFMDCSSGIRPGDVRSRAARVYAEHGLDLIIVDHMHIMRPDAPTGKQVQDLGAIAMELAIIYKQLNVAGVTLAQLNRDVARRAVKVPMLADLRESGQIEENAYSVMFLHRPAYYEPETENPNIAKIVVAKNRDGATGQVDVYWHPQLAVFRDLAIKEIDLNPQSNGKVWA